MISETIEAVDAAPRWKSYLVALLFATPATVSWLFARTYIVPKLMYVWHEVGPASGQEAGILNATRVLFGNALVPIAVCAAILLLLEWHGGGWDRYRKSALGILAWLITLVVFLAMTWLSISWAIVAPMLLKHS
jgi:hypothetical protein